MESNASAESDLRSWYLARMRRHFVEQQNTSMTPMTLVHQEAAVIKELISGPDAHQSGNNKPHRGISIGPFIMLPRAEFDAMTAQYRELAVKERALADFSAAWACSLDETGRITASNDASTRLTGTTPQELQGKLFAAYVAEAEVTRALGALQMARNAGSAEVTLCMRTEDQHLVHVEWSIECSRTAGGFFCIGHDVTSRRELEQLRQEFLEMITHDLKAPLANIVLASQMLRSGELSPDEQSKRIKTIETRAQRLLLFVNELLDIDKLEAGSLQLNLADCGVETVVERAIDMVDQLAAAKRIAIKRDVCAMQLRADDQRISQILVNLLSNAIKFSKAGSSVELVVKPTEQGLLFCVQDHGRGISEEDRKKIFDRFAQVELSDSTLKGGSGLGLAISKSLVEAHGGRLEVESEVGAGSKFFFVIPIQITSCQST
jgi:PAS domain S-box-containing protein